MTIVISYLAKDGFDLQALHTVGVQYDITTGYSTFKRKTPKHVRKDQKAITGRMISILHRSEQSYTFHFDKMHIDDLDDWREFRDSTRGGAATPFAIDATTVSGIEGLIENLVMTDTDAPVFDRVGTSDYFNVSFNCYRQPD